MALPEEFAPTGPKLSKFPIRPAPPVRPRLFPDEARFALRLALLAGGAECAAWVLLAAGGAHRAIIALAALRLLKPLWARLGTRLPRAAIAFTLLFVPLFCGAFVPRTPLAMVAAGLPAVADLCASCIGDTVTVERRSAAYAWLDMGQALGGAAGLAIGIAFGRWSQVAAIVALLVASVGVMDLHARGTPKSAWPLSAYWAALRNPLVWQLVLAAGVCGLALTKKNFFFSVPAWTPPGFRQPFRAATRRSWCAWGGSGRIRASMSSSVRCRRSSQVTPTRAWRSWARARSDRASSSSPGASGWQPASDSTATSKSKPATGSSPGSIRPPGGTSFGMTTLRSGLA